jgi:response regulator RpfG family c-di-GMP phosphodiesterase
MNPSSRPDAAGAVDQRLTILLVDDEERILRSLRMLFAVKYRVLMTTSGKEALDMLRRETVHVLISDQRMPIMAGVEVLRQAREISPNTMRLLLTGYSDLEAIIGSINEGEIFRYINKPWQGDEIQRLVAEAAEIARSLAQTGDASAATSASNPRDCDIMLVDQAPEIATAISNILHEQFPPSHRLEWATSVNEALSLLEKREFSIVISEIKIDGEDLGDFLKGLKRYHPQTATIVLTSHADTTVLMDLINQGQIHRFLPKPVHKTITARGIRSGIEWHQRIRDCPPLIQAHRVEVPKTVGNPGLIQRLRGIFSKIQLAAS